MILNNNIAQKVAKLLLQIKAIKLNTKNYFTWASGFHSPIYCDNRVLLSYPKKRYEVAQYMANQINDKFPKVTAIAAVATGGIGIGMLISHILNLPMIYVRPEPKKHGKQNQIEGFIDMNSKVVVIEDLISTGKSSLITVDALKQENLDVLGMMAVFSYELDVAKNNFENNNIEIYTLSNYFYLIESAVDSNYVKQDELETLKNWRKDPKNWNR